MVARKLESGKLIVDVLVGRRCGGRPDRRTERCDAEAKARKAECRSFLSRSRGEGRDVGRIVLSDFLGEVCWPQNQGLCRNSRDTYRQVLSSVLSVAVEMGMLRSNPARSDSSILPPKKGRTRRTSGGTAIHVR